MAGQTKKDPGEYPGFSCLRGKQTGSGIAWMFPVHKKDPGEYPGFSYLRGKQTGSGIAWIFSAERSVRQLHE
jgi:hypothetical protein